jgi:hypothetical protein
MEVHMPEDLPKISKSICDLAPPRSAISARIRNAGAKTLMAGLSLLGINVAASPTSSQAAEIAPAPIIANRKDKNQQSLVLQLASSLSNQISFLGHRSHSSHRSHYSSSGGGGSTATPSPTVPRTTTVPSPAAKVDSEFLTGAQTVTGKITEIQAEKQYFSLKDDSDKMHTIYFTGTTKVHLLSPSDQISTIDTLKAFTGSVPLKVGKSILVHWKTIDAKKTALQITFFELAQ